MSSTAKLKSTENNCLIKGLFNRLNADHYDKQYKKKSQQKVPVN